MSRPATAARRATHAGRAAPRPLRPVPGPRRVSGPTRTRPAAATTAPGILVGAAGLARTLPDSRALDRLIRGRTWVAVIAVALIGIVAMQVHMLGLNAGIGRAVEKATTLEQQNTALRLEVSRLGSGDRIATEAQQLGLVMPNAGEVRYTDVHATDATRAAKTHEARRPGSRRPGEGRGRGRRRHRSDRPGARVGREGAWRHAGARHRRSGGDPPGPGAGTRRRDDA